MWKRKNSDVRLYISPVQEEELHPNLIIHTLDLHESFILCINGVMLGEILPQREYPLAIETEDNSITELWLIPLRSIEGAEDLIYSNSLYSWTVKLYEYPVIREWNPCENFNTVTSQVTFVPPQGGVTHWDYIVGYEDGDTTREPLALLSPLDQAGITCTLNPDRIKITWKYYQHGTSINGLPVLLGEVDSDFVLVEGESARTIEIPPLGGESLRRFSLTINNNETYIIRLYLNGYPLENSMENPLTGSSYIEGKDYRNYRWVLGEPNNVLVVMGDEGELARYSFDAEDDDSIYLEYSEHSGVWENQDIPALTGEYAYLLDEPVLYLDFLGNTLCNNPSILTQLVSGSYGDDRFGNAEGALYLDGEKSFLKLSDDYQVMDVQEYSISFWVKSLGESTNYCLFKNYDSYYNNSTLKIFQDEQNGLSVSLLPDLYSYEDTILYSGDFSLSDGQWHMITLTRNAQCVSLYMDGSLVGQKNEIPWISYYYSQFYLGGRGAGDFLGFNGAMDDFRFFERQLSTEEIQGLYWEKG